MLINVYFPGKLHLNNAFVKENDRIYDKMHFNLRNLKLNRVKIDEAVDSNQVIATCPIIDPITFELEIKRNMMGTKTKDDPAELKVTGVLKEISASMSRGDYNVLMAILVENFQEKGEFELTRNAPKKPNFDKNALVLPVKSRYSGSRTSLSSDSVKSLRTAMKIDERHPLSKVVEFNFKFRGFQVKFDF